MFFRIYYKNEYLVNKGFIISFGIDNFINGIKIGSGFGLELYVVCISYVSVLERLMIWSFKRYYKYFLVFI